MTKLMLLTITRSQFPTLMTAFALCFGVLSLAIIGTFSAATNAWAGCDYGEENCFSVSGCAPAVVETNVSATDRTLHALASYFEFANATTFHSALRQLDGMNITGKIQTYKDYLGITDPSAFVAFLTARTNADRQVFIKQAMVSLELSDRQGELLIEALSKALVGDLL
ncbi:MAG: hypothetical protein OXC68_10665 [Aestuariivita sp.]|nr:hypothetical protein [Aestuariivita sp.]